MGEIFSRQGSAITFLNLSLFFGTGADFTSDTKILYDSSSERWFSSMIVLGPNLEVAHANVTIAVSLTSDPTSFWTVYNIDMGGRLPDQPILGVNNDKLIVSANMFSCNIYCNFGGPYLGAEYWVLNKNDLTSSFASVHVSHFGPDINLFSVHPVQTLGPSQTEYMVTVGSNLTNVNAPGRIACSDCKNPQLFSVTGVPPGNVTVRPFSLPILPINAPPCGTEPITPTSGCDNGVNLGINTVDSRVSDAVWFKDKLWFSLSDGCTPPGDRLRSCIRFVEIDTKSPGVLQNFNFFAAGQSYFYPAIRIDGAGDLNVVFGYSSSTIFPSIAVTGQAVIDQPNSLAPARTIKVGSTSDTSGRYGDYFGAAVDPSDPTLVWVAGEYHNLTTGSCADFGSCFSTFVAGIRMVAFTVTSNPTNLSTAAGSSVTSAVTLTSLQNFVGTVSISAMVSPVVLKSPKVTLTPSTASLTANGTATSTLTASAKGTTPGGLYTVNLTVASGPRSYLAILTLRVGPDFALSMNPSALALNPGSSGSSSVALSGMNGFTGSVILTPSVSPLGPSVALNPSSVPLSSGGSGNSTMTVTTTPTLKPGAYIVSLNCTTLGVSHLVVVVVNVIDFQMAANPASPSFVAGLGGSSTISLTGLGNFGGIVSLSTSPSSGLTASSSTSVRMVSGLPSTAVLTVSAAAKGNYTVKVTGTSGSLTHSLIIPVTATGDFTMFASPPSVTITQGATTTFSILLSSIKNFSGTVHLSLSGYFGLSASISPGVVTLLIGGQGSATLPVTASSLGNFGVTVTGTSGPLTHIISVFANVGGTVCIADPSTSGNCSVSGVVFNGPITTPATQLRVGIFIDDSSAFQGFDITLKADNTILAPADADLAGSMLPGTVVFTKCIGGLPKIGHCAPTDTADTTHVQAFSQSFSPQPSTGLLFTAVYNITGRTPNAVVGFQTGCTNTSVLGGICISIISRLANNPEVAKTGSFASGTGPFVAVSVSPLALGPVLVGTQFTSALTATSENGYPGPSDSGVVTLTSSAPSSVSVTLTPLNVNPLPNQTASITITISASTAGNYSFTVFGGYTVFNSTSGFTSTLSAPITLAIGIQDFRITATPTSLSTLRGSSTSSSITVTSLNGFSGTVTLSSIIFPSTANGPTISFNPSNVTQAAGGSGTSILTVSTTASTSTGSYAISVRGTGGSLTRQSRITDTVFNDFALSVSPTSLTINDGSTGTSTITVTSLGFFNGTVSLALTSPSGLSGSLASVSLKLPTGGSNSTALSVTANLPPGGTFTITATSGRLSHSTTVTVTVLDFSISSSPTTTSLGLAGASTTSSLSVLSLNGFSGTISLVASASPTGPVVSLWPNSVTLSPNGSASSTLDISAGGATPGTYTVTVTGTSGSLSHTATVTLTVTGDFSMSASPTSLTVRQGRAVTFTITLTSLNGFSGNITLASSATISINATAVDDTFCRSVGLLVDQTLDAQFWVTQPNSVIGIACRSLPFTYSKTYSLIAGSHFLEFGIGAWVGHWHIQIMVNGVVMADVDTNVYNHAHVAFHIGGGVSVSPLMSGGPTVSLTGTSVLLGGGGALASLILRVFTTKSTPTGTYIVTVTGTSGSLTHSTNIIVTVTTSGTSRREGQET